MYMYVYTQWHASGQRGLLHVPIARLSLKARSKEGRCNCFACVGVSLLAAFRHTNYSTWVRFNFKKRHSYASTNLGDLEFPLIFFKVLVRQTIG